MLMKLILIVRCLNDSYLLGADGVGLPSDVDEEFRHVLPDDFDFVSVVS